MLYTNSHHGIDATCRKACYTLMVIMGVDVAGGNLLPESWDQQVSERAARYADLENLDVQHQCISQLLHTAQLVHSLRSR